FQLGVGELLGHAAHDAVGAAHHGVVVRLVGLQGDKQVVGILAGYLGIARVYGLAEAVTVAGHAGALFHQFISLAGGVRRLGQCRGVGRMAVGLVIGGQVSHVLVAQRIGNAAHRRVLALALFVRIQRRNDVLGTLTRDLGHLVNLGETGLV